MNASWTIPKSDSQVGSARGCYLWLLHLSGGRLPEPPAAPELSDFINIPNLWVS